MGELERKLVDNWDERRVRERPRVGGELRVSTHRNARFGVFEGAAYEHNYDVVLDGRFVIEEAARNADGELPEIVVIENWYEEFRDRD